jgi:hypothetical protein
MAPSIQLVKFQETEIGFDFTGSNVMVNATEMSKIFGTDTEAFMRNKDTKRFIEECLKTENSRFLFVEKEEDLIVSKQKSGTWMHRIFALKFAAWPDPSFELWVYKTIDDLLFGRFKRYVAEVEHTEKAKQKLRELEEKKMEDPEYLEIIELRKVIAGSGKRRAMALNGQLELFS